MPIFHFNLVDGEQLEDLEGHHCADVDEAKSAAQLIARRLAETRPGIANKHYAIQVTDEDGREVAREPVRQASS